MDLAGGYPFNKLVPECRGSDMKAETKASKEATALVVLLAIVVGVVLGLMAVKANQGSSAPVSVSEMMRR